MLRQYVDEVSESIIDALEKFDNPTTVIYNNPKKIAKNLIPKDNTIAIRIVQDEFCKKLIKEFGKPIVSTSANVSGQATPKSFKEISSAILKGVDYIVNLHHEKTCNKPSSIIKLSNSGVVEVIRE
jgi:L-threonylcarbamoyladenylate synthase